MSRHARFLIEVEIEIDEEDLEEKLGPTTLRAIGREAIVSMNGSPYEDCVEVVHTMAQIPRLFNSSKRS